MSSIDIDFDVFKALTNLRRSEEMSYNDVLRELLGLEESGSVAKPSNPPGRWMMQGVSLPDGTMLRATYKGRGYYAKIVDGHWMDEEGDIHASPSAAATAISHTNSNGWRFWHAKRPGDADWHRLDGLK